MQQRVKLGVHPCAHGLHQQSITILEHIWVRKRPSPSSNRATHQRLPEKSINLHLRRDREPHEYGVERPFGRHLRIEHQALARLAERPKLAHTVGHARRRRRRTPPRMSGVMPVVAPAVGPVHDALRLRVLRPERQGARPRDRERRPAELVRARRRRAPAAAAAAAASQRPARGAPRPERALQRWVRGGVQGASAGAAFLLLLNALHNEAKEDFLSTPVVVPDDCDV
jgi:hypothetical protein